MFGKKNSGHDRSRDNFAFGKVVAFGEMNYGYRTVRFPKIIAKSTEKKTNS